LASCTTLVAMTRVPICVRMDWLKGITFLACLDEATLADGCKVTWRIVARPTVS
jgi:hypothetical protein